MNRYGWIPFFCLWLLYWLFLPIYSWWVATHAPFSVVILRGMAVLAVHAFVAWVNWGWLVRSKVLRRSWARYLSAAGLLSVLGASVLCLFDIAFIGPLGYGIKQSFGAGVQWVMMLFGLMFPLLLSGTYGVYQIYFEKVMAERDLKSAKAEAELNLLKNQVNPHFMFNTLNHLHTLTKMKSDKAAPNLLKLSDMLRYMLYECRYEAVMLCKEINYLNDYLDLQQLKTRENQNIEWRIEGNAEGKMVAPMMFMPFFENVVKHGNLTDTEKGWMRGVLRIREDIERIDFELENSLPHPTLRKQSNGGIGLPNIRQRLDLIYPGEHYFNTICDGDTFLVQLSMPYKSERSAALAFPDAAAAAL